MVIERTAFPRRPLGKSLTELAETGYYFCKRCQHITELVTDGEYSSIPRCLHCSASVKNIVFIPGLNSAAEVKECAYCVKELGRKPTPGASHGICGRHYEAEVESLLATQIG